MNTNELIMKNEQSSDNANNTCLLQLFDQGDAEVSMKRKRSQRSQILNNDEQNYKYQ